MLRLRRPLPHSSTLSGRSMTDEKPYKDALTAKMAEAIHSRLLQWRDESGPSPTLDIAPEAQELAEAAYEVIPPFMDAECAGRQGT